ncbi:hypothetical protein [Phocaeicola sp.]|uniref:hypothetical protein n=1 Tax=Phocaeicola sp. TaxID=2773926 RepID=UPI003A94594F
MMTKEEVASIVLYCKEHNVSFKSRFEELGIVPWRFYEAKCRYGKDKSNGLLEIGSQGIFIPCPDLNHHTKRPTDCSTDSGNMSIELQTSTGVIMRIQGCLDSAQLQSIILSATGHV